MLLNTSRGKFIVKFKYDESCTECILFFIPIVTSIEKQVHPRAFGYAHCSPKDVFNKQIGRKLALKRAIAEVLRPPFQDKTFRLELWKSYFSQVKDGINLL